MLAYVTLCAPSLFRCPWRPEYLRFLGTGVIDGCELPPLCVCVLGTKLRSSERVVSTRNNGAISPLPQETFLIDTQEEQEEEWSRDVAECLMINGTTPPTNCGAEHVGTKVEQ